MKTRTLMNYLLALTVVAAAAPSQADAGWRHRGRGCPQPCQQCYPGAPTSPADADGVTDLGDDFDLGGDIDFGPQQNVIPMGEQPVTSPDAFAMNMIGDFYFPAGSEDDTFGAQGPGAHVFKVSDNGVVLPVDRVFFNYHHYHNALYYDGGRTSVDRYTFGVEKTFFDGLTSLEVRIPFAHTADTHQVTANGFATATEFGNIQLIPKVLLVSNAYTNVAIGLGIGLPTSSDTYIDEGGASTTIESESVVLVPFLGFNHSLSSRWWLTGYIQTAFDTNGNGILEDGVRVGIYQEQTLLSLDLALNYELYFNPSARYFRRIVPTVELHYTTTLQSTDVVELNGGGTSYSNQFGHLDILNLTAGFHIDVTQLSRLSVAAVAPLRHEQTGDLRLPDSEITVQFNRFF